MWDEQERFARVIAKLFLWLLGAVGVVLITASVATGIPDFFFGYLQLLGVLAAFVLVYGLVAASVGGVLLGIICGVNCGFRWFRNHDFNRPPDR